MLLSVYTKQYFHLALLENLKMLINFDAIVIVILISESLITEIITEEPLSLLTLTAGKTDMVLLHQTTQPVVSLLHSCHILTIGLD